MALRSLGILGLCAVLLAACGPASETYYAPDDGYIYPTGSAYGAGYAQPACPNGVFVGGADYCIKDDARNAGVRLVR